MPFRGCTVAPQSIKKGNKHMTDFNYSEYSVEVLENAIKNCSDDIKRIKSTAKRYNRNLTLNNGRGYSNDKKAYFESYIKYVPTLIASREAEIAGCKAEMASRVAVIKRSQEALQEFFKANEK